MATSVQIVLIICITLVVICAMPNGKDKKNDKKNDKDGE